MRPQIGCAYMWNYSLKFLKGQPAENLKAQLTNNMQKNPGSVSNIQHLTDCLDVTHYSEASGAHIG